MKATTLLTSQHRKIERLIAALANEETPRHIALGDLVEGLLEHMVMEEAVFYWISRQSLVPDVADSYLSHGCARETLTELMNLDATDIDFRTSVRELALRFSERNASEDENLIPRMELLFSDVQLEKIAQKIEALYLVSLRDSDVDAA